MTNSKYHIEGSKEFASVAATCDRNQVESVPFFSFIYIFLSKICEIKCAMAKAFHEFCTKLPFCSFSLEWCCKLDCVIHVSVNVRTSRVYFFILLRQNVEWKMWYYLLFSAIILSQKLRHISFSLLKKYNDNNILEVIILKIIYNNLLEMSSQRILFCIFLAVTWA